MPSIRLFTDEDVYGSLASRLRKRGFDAVSTPEVSRLGTSDESQLAWATKENRVLLTFNVADFARLHNLWMKQARHHAGIVVSSQRPIGDLLRRLLSLASSLGTEPMRDRLVFLAGY